MTWMMRMHNIELHSEIQGLLALGNSRREANKGLVCILSATNKSGAGDVAKPRVVWATTVNGNDKRQLKAASRSDRLRS
jgi:hypothetical protein